ncbi:hypothetical protein HPB52_013877 [Rhipicephalus sanguineus]|uniref:Uncharacterized protein n=1 Tax=Rhipicephalus sanguineus TaxID=34632 RepID=A0A9D4SYG4_RHISA|nr:hypothetical protein HPB52_013877 [Rhipicephalus sanguineus]
MEDLLQPFEIGQDIALFLVNFERTCEKAGFPLESWPQELLTLLPCEAADVIARLNRKDAVSYDKVKEALLRKCRLSAKGFQQRLSHTRKARTSEEGTHGGRGKMANRHAECLRRGTGSVLALVSDGQQEVTEVRDTLFSQCGNVGSAECKGQREGSLKGSDKARVREETLQSKLTSLESVAAVVQSQDITDEDREGSSVQPFGALTPQSSSRAKRKRPQDRNAAKVATRLRKKFGRRREIARRVRLSLLTGFYSMRMNHQENRRRVAHGSRNRSEDELMRNHQDSKRETAEEHVDADEHRRRTECSKVCTKKRAKGRKRQKDRNATKVVTRLRKKFKSRREIARQVRLPSGTGFYRMRPYRRKKKKREAHDSRKESAGKGTSRCSFRRASDQVRDCRRPSSRKKKKREAHDSRKGSVGKRTPRCSFRGTLKQVRHREVGDLREVAGGDKEKSATGKVVRLDEGVINFHAYRTPRLTRKAFWARPPRVRLKSC